MPGRAGIVDPKAGNALFPILPIFHYSNIPEYKI
jgi:hypothetical protein